MQKEQYIGYHAPTEPYIEWTDKQLFDEVDFVAIHRAEIHSTGERDQQLKDRMSLAVGEQALRYYVKKRDEEAFAWVEHETV